MAAGEPSAEQLEKFSTLEEVATWTQMSPDVSGPLFKIIRATGQGHPRTLGMMEEDEVLAETTKMTINDSPLTSMQKGSIRSVAHGRYFTIQEQGKRRRASGKTEKEVIKLAAQPLRMSIPQVQLKHVVSQGNKER